MEDPIINIKQAIRQLSECGVNTSELMSATLKAADMFLEIKESEDERIRKMLVEQMERWKKCAEDNNVEQDVKDASAAISYLEKQKVQKGSLRVIKDASEWEKIKEQKHAEWSEEDEKMIERLIYHTHKEFDELCNDRYGHQDIVSDLKESCRERLNWLENRLKSLGSQPHWKPSEEQMDALETAVSTSQSTALESLYNDLKKLM